MEQCWGRQPGSYRWLLKWKYGGLPLFSAVPRRINRRMRWDSHLRPQRRHPASVFFTAAPRTRPSDIPLPGIGWGFLSSMED